MDTVNSFSLCSFNQNSFCYWLENKLGKQAWLGPFSQKQNYVMFFLLFMREAFQKIFQLIRENF